jgi:hypothetical protein
MRDGVVVESIGMSVWVTKCRANKAGRARQNQGERGERYA